MTRDAREVERKKVGLHKAGAQAILETLNEDIIFLRIEKAAPGRLSCFWGTGLRSSLESSADGYNRVELLRLLVQHPHVSSAPSTLAQGSWYPRVGDVSALRGRLDLALRARSRLAARLRGVGLLRDSELGRDDPRRAPFSTRARG